MSAVDTGIAVNPDTIVAQLQGGLIFGLTAALYGEITIDKGRVQQSNFHDYRMLRIDEMPKIEVHVIKSGEPPGGIGETGANAGPPALRNAIYAATGVALRRLPIDRALLAGGRRHERTARIILSVVVDRRWSRLGIAVWIIRGPGPLAFAGGPKVALADYRGANPTGVPASLAKASPIERGEYLARAADCMVCHTAAGGKEYAGGLGFKLPFGTLYSTNITPDKETGIGNYSDQDFLNAVQHGMRRDGAHALSGDAVHVLHLHDRRRRAGDQGLSVQPAAGARGGAREHADLPVQPALGDGVLVGAVQSGHALQAGYVEERRNGIAAPISPKRWRIAANAIRRAISPSRSTTARNSPARSRPAGARSTSPRDKATGVGGWSDDELVAYLSTGHANGRGTASGPMGEAVDHSSEQACARRHPRDRRLSAQRAGDGLAPTCRRRRRRAAPASHKEGLDGRCARQDGVQPAPA